VPRSFRGSQARTPRSRRQTAWGAGPGSVSATPIVSSTPLFLGASVIPTVEGLTIARIRGQLDFYLGLATAPLDGFQGAIGIGVATAAAVAAGITAVPTPITEADSENWLFWHPLSVHNPIASSTRLHTSSFQRIIIDTKAMRRFPAEMSLYACVDITEIGTASGDIYFDTRALFFLP